MRRKDEKNVSRTILKKSIFFLTIVIIVLIVLNINSFYNLTLLGITKVPFLYSNSVVTSKNTFEEPEITAIKQLKNSKPQSPLYRKLIERIGPEAAQEALYRSGLPFDGETHLLNHTVGDYLYEKDKEGGIALCKDYFLSSCYHQYILRAIGEKGLSSLNKIMNKCWNVGRTTATQCAHGIGHGLLVYKGYYDLPKALEECKNLQAISPNFPRFNCEDGVFMENIWAVHEDGKPSPDRWVNPQDHIYPCNSDQIAEEYIKACWSNQPHLMFQLFKGDLERVGQECLKLTNNEYQKTCFDALARQIHPLTRGSVDQTFALCHKMPNDWIDPCIFTIVGAYYSVGDRVIPYEICNRLTNERKDYCDKYLASVVKSYSE